MLSGKNCTFTHGYSLFGRTYKNNYSELVLTDKFFFT